jgi:hypothetical protein
MRLIFVGSTKSGNTSTKHCILFTKDRKNTQIILKVLNTTTFSFFNSETFTIMQKVRNIQFLKRRSNTMFPLGLTEHMISVNTVYNKTYVILCLLNNALLNICYVAMAKWEAMNVDCKEWHNGRGIYLEQLVETTEKVNTLDLHIQTTDFPIMNANYYTRFYQSCRK